MTKQEFGKAFFEAITIKLLLKGRNKGHQSFNFNINLPESIYEIYKDKGNEYDVLDYLNGIQAEYFYDYGYDIITTVSKNGKQLHFTARLINDYTEEYAVEALSTIL